MLSDGDLETGLVPSQTECGSVLSISASLTKPDIASCTQKALTLLRKELGSAQPASTCPTAWVDFCYRWPTAYFRDSMVYNSRRIWSFSDYFTPGCLQRKLSTYEGIPREWGRTHESQRGCGLDVSLWVSKSLDHSEPRLGIGLKGSSLRFEWNWDKLAFD